MIQKTIYASVQSIIYVVRFRPYSLQPTEYPAMDDYTPPSVTEYGDVKELTAASDFFGEELDGSYFFFWPMREGGENDLS